MPAVSPSPADHALLWAPPLRLKPPIIPSPLAHLVPREQVLLYSLVFASAPERCLEVGVKNGGGSRIIHAALSDLGRGRFVGLDPEPELKFDWAELADRATLMVGRSPEDLPRAAQAVGGLFDFVFLDGDHTAPAVERDFEGLAPVTSPGALILCHDAHFEGVIDGIQRVLRRGLPFEDRGLLARTPNPVFHGDAGAYATWGGLRLIARLPDDRTRGWRSRLTNALFRPRRADMLST